MKMITKKQQATIKFIDLFCGIGGFHQAIQLASKDICNIECVFSSDIDTSVQKTYFSNYGLYPQGDITQIVEQNIPSHDFLFAGFPCQAFSVAGHRKGFDDIRGTLFFDIARVAKIHQPKVILLENVKGLISHESGRTFNTILDVLTKDLNYHIQYKVINTAKYANIPQNRERIYIVATKKKVDNVFPEEVKLNKTIADIIFHEKQDDKYYYNQHRYYPQLQNEITKKDTVYQWRRHYVRENKNNLCPTLTANMGTGGYMASFFKYL